MYLVDTCKHWWFETLPILFIIFHFKCFSKKINIHFPYNQLTLDLVHNFNKCYTIVTVNMTIDIF